ncbi:MAG: hypothetical protein KGJ21_09900 [Pseudomonadota bacterium]|nr:hypothetical protein [Pseudomonadota bacterium]
MKRCTRSDFYSTMTALGASPVNDQARAVVLHQSATGELLGVVVDGPAPSYWLTDAASVPAECWELAEAEVAECAR